jgi:hypothetical protein
MRGSGTIHLRGGGRIGLHLELGSHAVARRAVSLLHEYGVQCEIRTYRRRAFEHETRFEIHLDDDARSLQVLNEAGIVGAGLAPLERPPARLVARSCCRAAYLRGSFLAAGSVSGPGDAHLELRANDADGAEVLSGLADRDGFALGVAERRGHAFAYAKGNETIAELLAFLGAQEAALLFGERAVVSATKARANRLANADHANLRRSSGAAEAQLRAIEHLREQGGFEHLDPKLREAADLRVRHPTSSLRELAVRCKPPATKAAVHRRLMRLRRLAES